MKSQPLMANSETFLFLGVVKYYVYELVVVPDGTVCYVGCGKGKRMYAHRRNLVYSTRYKRPQTQLYTGLRALLAAGKDFKPRKVFETDDKQEAQQEEARRIRELGAGVLLNVRGYTPRKTYSFRLTPAVYAWWLEQAKQSHCASVSELMAKNTEQ